MNDEGTPAPTTSTDEHSAVTTSRPAWLQALKIIAPAILAFAGSLTWSGSKSDDVKDKAEAGYQFARQDIEEIKDSLKALQDNDAKMAIEIADIKRRAKLSAASRRREAVVAAAHPPATPTVNVNVNAPTAPLPADLDKALEAQKATK